MFLMKIVSSFIAISLSGIMILNIFHIPLTYAYYYLDQSGFIELLCENKEEPELECNGKCHLKKLTQNDTESNDKPLPIVLERELILFFENPEKETVIRIVEDSSIFDQYLTHYSFTTEYNHFHPPQA